jgi:hypothetical protein
MGMNVVGEVCAVVFEMKAGENTGVERVERRYAFCQSQDTFDE